jgi:hypothetical protein
MTGFSDLGKRLARLESAISFRAPRNIVLTIPVDDTGKTSAETDAMVAELHQRLAVRDDDFVVHVKHYGASADEFESLNPGYFKQQS